MLINFTNHPSSEWEKNQKEASAGYGEIVDIPFPVIAPECNESEVEELAKSYSARCISIIGNKLNGSAVHIMGEMTFCYSVVKKLREAGIKCLASTTKREVTSEGSLKLAEFSFVRFREYC